MASSELDDTAIAEMAWFFLGFEPGNNFIPGKWRLERGLNSVKLPVLDAMVTECFVRAHRTADPGQHLRILSRRVDRSLGEALKYLFDAGASLRSQDGHDSPLHLAVFYGAVSVSAVKTILETAISRSEFPEILTFTNDNMHNVFHVLAKNVALTGNVDLCAAVMHRIQDATQQYHEASLVPAIISGTEEHGVEFPKAIASLCASYIPMPGLNDPNENGSVPLMEICSRYRSYRYCEAAKLFVRLGADPEPAMQAVINNAALPTRVPPERHTQLAELLRYFQTEMKFKFWHE